MKEYLDKTIKADKCAQYLAEIGTATNSPEELKNNLREVFQCVRTAGLRLTMAKYQFGANKSNSSDEISPHQEWHPRTTKFKSFYKRSNSPEQRPDSKDTSGLYIITKFTFPDYQRISPPFTSLSSRTHQPK